MGLYVSHGCWHGSYRAFHDWRNALARAAGCEFARISKEVEVHEGESKPFLYRIELERPEFDYSSITHENMTGEWERCPDDPLIILLVHSDCEGIVPAKYCEVLANRLDGLSPMLREEWLTKATEEFSCGLRKAAALGEDVYFC